MGHTRFVALPMSGSVAQGSDEFPGAPWLSSTPWGGKGMLPVGAGLPRPLLLGGKEWDFCILSPLQVRLLVQRPLPSSSQPQAIAPGFS